jgi:multicomponent Na+:H+ antiporter subunit E
MRFSIGFLGRCVVAGVDVARRAFGPRDAIQPGFVDVALTLPPGAPRSLLTGVVSLVPGTLSVAIQGDVLRTHVLDLRTDARSDIAKLEYLVAGVFVSPSGGGSE